MRRQSMSRVGIGAVGLGVLLSVTAVDARAADEIGVPCARAKLRAVDKATGSLIQCYATARGFGAVDPTCVARVEQRMARTFATAERQGCFGFQDDLVDIWTLVQGYVQDLIRNLAPPAGCHLEGDGLTCGGVCPPGSTCSALGEQCGCYPDLLMCNATAVAPALCPKIGQTCAERACVDPDGGYCRVEPLGSGHVEGFCLSDSVCLALPMGSGVVASCLQRAYACEDPAGFCATSGTAFGFCTDATKTCGADCLCH